MGPGVLEQVLRELPPVVDPRLLVKDMDDAAVVQVNEHTILVQTLDFFTPIVDDPYLFGQIAATNSLSDVYAMGGVPVTAMNIVCFPTKTLGAEVLGAILRGGADKVREAECLLIGGHTVEDAEPKYGLSVTGLVERDQVMAKNGARVGDRLVLTKPLGTGIVTTALKRELARTADVDAAVESMRALNKTAATWGRAHGVRAATDVTGFGLLGHGLGMAQTSNVSIRIRASKLPLLPGTEEYLEAGCFPGGSQANLAYVTPFVTWDDKVTEASRKILADAQTAGGLLMCVPASHWEATPGWWEIGEVVAAGARPLEVLP